MDANEIRRAIEQTQAEIDKRREALHKYTVGGLRDRATPSMIELLQGQVISFESQLAQLGEQLKRAIGH
jgi:hypothetical protein